MLTQNLKQRLTFGLLGSAALILLIFLAENPFFRPLFVLALSGVVGVAAWEYFQMAKTKGLHPLQSLGIFYSVLYVWVVFLSTQFQSAHLLPEIIFGIAFLSFFVSQFYKTDSPFLSIPVTLFGMIYLAIPLSCALLITYFPFKPLEDGRVWLLYGLLVTKSTDTGAYFVGKIKGRRRLAPTISPKKTWEGAYGGMITAVSVSLLFYFCVLLFLSPTPISLTFWESLGLGLAIPVVAQLGDLAESLLKRDAGFKDSNQLPGLGGMLDIVDSLVFTLPLLYIFLKMR
jgi:phosphatidate cytidylyltransferase